MRNVTRRNFLATSSLAALTLMTGNTYSSILPGVSTNNKRIGIIGLDTSHSIAFARLLNANREQYSNFEIVTAYPYGTKTIPSSTDRIPQYIEDVQKFGVKIAKSIKDLLQQVDYVLLETNDGRLHLEQAKEVIKAGKPLFIDKPIAASYQDAAEIFALSEKYNVPFFSTSSMRYIDGMEDVVAGKYGKVLGADVYSPALFEPSHPDFFWYGIHAVEMLFTAMGAGCKSMSRTHSQDVDILVGVWDDGRLGTVRGTRQGKRAYGGTIYCENGNVTLDTFSGYDPLLKKIVDFFETKSLPFDSQETLAICAFMEAADISKENQGRSVALSEITSK